MKTKRAYRYRLYRTLEQEALIARTFGCVRFVYNRVLRWRTDEFHKNGNSISCTDASRRLTDLKKDPGLQWLNDVSSVPIQQTLRHQQEAFKKLPGRQGQVPDVQKEAQQAISNVCVV